MVKFLKRSLRKMRNKPLYFNDEAFKVSYPIPKKIKDVSNIPSCFTDEPKYTLVDKEKYRALLLEYKRSLTNEN